MFGDFITKLIGLSKTPASMSTPAGQDQSERLSAGRMKTLLEKHRRWLASGGKEGARLVLQGAVLSQGGGRLANVSLRQADLRGAVLRGMTLDNVLLSSALLRDADLSGINAAKARGLRANQLAGADLSGSRLPPGFVFPALEGIAEAARTARLLFVILLLACLYALTTVAGTTDASLFLNTPSAMLPIVQAPIRMPQFYWLAPLLIALLFAVSHLYLLRLWQRVARLPAVYPDGSTADQQLPAWLFHGFVSAYWPRLRQRRPPLFWLQHAVSIFLAWLVAPLTMAVLWARYLVRHDALGTILQLVLLVTVSGLAIYVFSLAGAVLRGEFAPEADPAERRRFWALFTPWHGIVTACAAFALALYSVKAVGAFGLQPFHAPDLSWANLAGADLKHADLSGANLYRTNLAGADLRGAMLDGANLDEAELTSAKLGQAKLDKATLRGARLERADLNGAWLRDAVLDGAQLSGATFTHADLTRASIRKADLRGVAMDSAQFGGADFSATDLSKANLSYSQAQESRFTSAKLENADLRAINLTAADLTRAQLRGVNLENATLLQIKAPGAVMGEANLRASDMKFSILEGADLRQADLSRADIRGANLTGAAFAKTDLSGANLIDAQLDCVRLSFANFDRETRLPESCARLRVQ